MKRFLTFLPLFAILFNYNDAYASETCDAAITHAFKDKKGCFLLYNLSQQRYEVTYGGALCDTRFSPASTFKIPNSLIGLDLAILKDENTLYRWDGTQYRIKEHEQDHTLKSAIKVSAVWYYQRLAEKVGEAHYRQYLKKLDYGNQDISGGLTTFWLGTSLTISPKEQVTFLEKLYRNQLPVSAHAIETVKKILVLESSEQGTLSGKTGTESVNGTNIGWFVGHVDAKGEEYLFATNLQAPGTDYKIDTLYAGPRAKEVAREILKCKGLL